MRDDGNGVDIGAFELQTLNLIVDTISDENNGDFSAGDLSLREAIVLANDIPGADTITFSSLFLAPQTIDLVSQLPTITEELTITSPNLGRLTLDAGGGINGTPGNGDGYRLLNIDDGDNGSQIDVAISGLTLTGGDVSSVDINGLGGAIRNLENLILTGSTLSGNSARFGGGIRNQGTANIVSSTISGNSASADGGGVSNSGGTTNITSSTITGNSAYFYAGGIQSSNTVTLNNTIVAGNTDGRGIPDVAGPVSGTFNLIGDGTGQTGIANGVDNNQVGNSDSPIDPLLGPLADNGGPTLTRALLPGSPAIDAGSSIELSDQRGAPFLRDDGNGVDIGAFERQTLNLVVDTISDENNGDFSAGDLSLREAIVLANDIPGADTITFSSLFLNPQKIDLGSQLPTIFRELTITGPGADLLTLDADGGADGTIGNGDGYRLLNIDDGDNDNLIEVAISGLTLTGGDVPVGDLFGQGGAIRNRENLTVTGSTLTGNAALHGGGIQIYLGTTNIIDSTISGNSATLGGGIHELGTANITSSTISDNSAIRGGGIYNLGTANINSSTITGNLANRGGGIYNRGPATLTNSIVAMNTTVTLAGPDIFAFSPLSGTFNLIGNGTGLNGIVHGSNGNQVGTSSNLIDPLLGPLANNGGPTQTHALLAGSPALDAGDPSILFDVNEFDQRGTPFVRVFDDPGASGTGIDIGAYERRSLTLVVDTTSDENDGDFSTGQLSLREAIDLANGNADADTITFGSLFLATQKIDLDSQLPTITGDLTITGPGQDLLTLDARGGDDNMIGNGDGYRLLNIDDGDNGNLIEVAISGLTLTGGDVPFADLDGKGGAIRNLENLTLTGSTLSGNSAGNVGGGIFNDNGTATITNSTFIGNSAEGGGGIFNGFDSTTTITSSTISGNSATIGVGGGIFNNGSTTTITSSTISGNSATIGAGGGIFNNGGTTTITSSTISGNSATFAGGISSFAGGTTTLNNTILAANTAVQSDPDIRFSSSASFFTGTFNLIGDGTGQDAFGDGVNGNQVGTSSNPIDPLLGPLADNGGPTQTHALLPGSPAIDAGSSIEPFDQRGAPFLRDDGNGVDVGAYELQNDPADFDIDGDVDGADFLAWQRGFGTIVPNATKTDGDADNDTDVDADDLNIWESQFGTAAPAPLATLAATESTEVATVSSGGNATATSERSPSQKNAKRPPQANLIDAALATEWLGVATDKSESPVFSDQAWVEMSFASATTNDDFVATKITATEFAPLASNSDEIKVTVEPWLTDEMLERVFG